MYLKNCKYLILTNISIFSNISWKCPILKPIKLVCVASFKQYVTIKTYLYSNSKVSNSYYLVLLTSNTKSLPIKWYYHRIHTWIVKYIYISFFHMCDPYILTNDVLECLGNYFCSQ